MGYARKGGGGIFNKRAGSNARKALSGSPFFLFFLFSFCFANLHSTGVLGSQEGTGVIRGPGSYGHELDEDLNIGLDLCFCVLAGFWSFNTA